jgi:cyclophilin family peptidyl-prolyl cis-trans isomerase
VTTNKQRRQAAQRHLQRQLERRAELNKKRRRNLGILASAIAVLVVVGAALLITGVFKGDDDPEAAADATTSDSATATTAAARSATPTQGTSTLLMSTNQGDLTLTLDRAKAPCAAASFTYLAQQSFFDGSSCHRLVNQPSFGVLQCGDPTGTGSGGPSYKYAEEVTAETTYPRGTIAMAKTSAPNTTGSQFFLCFVDTELPPQYTVVGTVDEAGIAVLEKVAAGGIEGVGAEGDGAPAIPVTVNTLSVVA